MVTVDDATYVKMRDTLYWGDAWRASKAKAQIEANYTDEKYNTFLWQLNNMPQQTQGTPATPTQNETPTTPVPETPSKWWENNGSTVPEVKQEWALTPLSQEYYNQTNDIALNQIRDNLNRYKQSNPEYFTTYEDFQKNFSYNARSEEQKTLLDNWYKWYQQGLSLASTPTSDLYSEYKNGNLSDTQLANLKVYDPTKYAELQSQINKGNIVAAYDDDKWEKNSFDKLRETRIQNMINNLTTAWSQASEIFASYEEKMNSPEMMELSDKTTEIQEQIENIQDDIASMTKAVEKEYEWTGASRSKISAIVADRTYDLQLQLRTLNNEYSKYANQYNNRMNQYQTEFSMELQEYQINQQERQMQMQEMWFAMDLMSFETPEQAQERQWNYWVKQQQYANGDINSKDQATRMKAALNSVNDLLSQYNGIPMERSPEQMAEDVLKDIDNWLTLWEALTKINKQIQQKPEYKQAYNNTYGGGSSFSKPETFKIGDEEYLIWNGELMKASEFNKAYWAQWQAKYYMPVSEDKLSMTVNPGDKNLWKFVTLKWANGMKWGQCGKYVNDYLEYIWMWRYYDDDLSTKLNSINTYTPKVWGIAVFDYNHKSSDWVNYGHVGIVVGIDEKNRTITIKDSNYGSDEKIQTRTISMNDPALRWFFDPTQPYGNVEASSTTVEDEGDFLVRDYVKGREWLYDDYLNAAWKPTDAMLKGWGNWDINKWLQIFEAEVRDYQEKTGVWTLETKKTNEVNKLRTEMHGNQAYTDYNQMQSYFEKIKQNTNNETATAASDVALLFNFMKMLDPKSIVRESEFKTAQNMGSLPEKWKAAAIDAVNGKKLTNEQRTMIYNESAWLMDGATHLYNDLLDDYSSMIVYGGDPSRLWKKWTYYTEEYQNMYGGGVKEWDSDLAKSWWWELTQSNTYVNVLWYELNSDWNKIPVIWWPRAIR